MADDRGGGHWDLARAQCIDDVRLICTGGCSNCSPACSRRRRWGSLLLEFAGGKGAGVASAF
jgi:hypothetical protein